MNAEALPANQLVRAGFCALKRSDSVKRIRIMMTGIILLGLLVGGICIYEFVRTEPEESSKYAKLEKTADFTGEDVEEIDSPGAKEVPTEVWNVFDGGWLDIMTETQLDKAESITIPATYNGKKVRSISLRNYTDGSSTPFEYLRHAEIEEGVEEIKDAFVKCPNLKTVVLPKSIKKIDKFTFHHCKKTVTVYVKKNSYAEKWAKKHKIRYKYGRPKEGA